MTLSQRERERERESERKKRKKERKKVRKKGRKKKEKKKRNNGLLYRILNLPRPPCPVLAMVMTPKRIKFPEA